MKVTVLGGCGAVGGVAAKTLAAQPDFSEVCIADANLDRLDELRAQSPEGKITGVRVDAGSREQVQEAVSGSSVVLNCVGPFYKTVKTVLSAVLDAGIPYVDICDDVDVTTEILDWDQRAKDAGVTALIGMGSSPGATNLLAKFAAETLLDETESVDIFHAHGGEPFEGPGVVGHRFHCMTIPVPMFLDGKLTTVDYFGPDGIALRQEFDFPVLGKGVMLYPYPHPEQVTLPRYISLKQVTNKGTVLPSEYYDLTRDLCALGLNSKEPLEVNGKSITPHDFAVAYIIKMREKILEKTGFGGQRGCCSVVARGVKDGRPLEYRFHMASASQALGEGTGIPAAAGVLLMARGKIREKGVLPPEGCVNPLDFIELIPGLMHLDEKKEGGDSFGGVIVEEVDEHGNVKKLDIG
ncbi:MAG: saccharopine dehydrogenase NADP-binding domain-containing protein [Deltaproteobacteria bacterium]|nr:saccharopine dehydrogenase NADP-binding domain-containing protein [Deltaproteobacteria bacterium]